MLGGVARLRSEAPSPGVELRIAGVGPLTSAVLGAAFAGLAVGLDVFGASGLVVEAVGWLAAINIVLAVFNAVPAAPLDGGRLLRAFLWHRTGDAVRATRSASAAGRALGWFMVIAGFAAVLFGADVSGLWPALVGWFLITAATEETRHAELAALLAGLPVRRVMTHGPITVAATKTVAGFLAEGPFGTYRHSAFPVLAPDGAPVGLVTVRLLDRVAPQARASTTIADVMRPLVDVTTAAPDEAVVGLLPRLEASAERRALVLDAGRLVGIVTLADISRAVSWLTATTRPPT
ncbi:CBS domain-containing protein [Streptomyces sp. 7R015]|uniref:CBS domain-containing protein n=2 Tax=Streptomyces cylindrosporus TaxID=2927583 RepID=A0ABS9YM13_9ACTN|nr:CBS domain-containing protein [Streptomyces cylindrosporus]